jgi:hypothetical protein
MDGTKQWYRSKTVWGGLVALAAGLARAAGIEVDAALQGEIADSLLAIASALGGLVAIYGRLVAETRLG